MSVKITKLEAIKKMHEELLRLDEEILKIDKLALKLSENNKKTRIDLSVVFGDKKKKNDGGCTSRFTYSLVWVEDNDDLLNPKEGEELEEDYEFSFNDTECLELLSFMSRIRNAKRKYILSQLEKLGVTL